VKSTDELKTTLGNLRAEPRAAIFQITDDLFENEAEFVFATARQKKIATMFNEESWAIGGATAAYGPSYFEMGRLAAQSIDQIIKGKAPSTLPIAARDQIRSDAELPGRHVHWFATAQRSAEASEQGHSLAQNRVGRWHSMTK
jgi:ABC-type uncharacterized transport system substrate-binding protein